MLLPSLKPSSGFPWSKSQVLTMTHKGAMWFGPHHSDFISLHSIPCSLCSSHNGDWPCSQQSTKHTHTLEYTQNFKPVLFIMSKTNHRPSIREWINRLFHIATVKYWTIMEKWTIALHKTWINLNNKIVSEKRKSLKFICRFIFFN